MNTDEAKKISLFRDAAEDYKKALNKRAINIDNGQNGHGHDLTLIYRSAEISPTGKQIIVHFTKREEYRKVVGYKTVNHKKRPIYGESVRKDSESLIKLPYRYENASYLETEFTDETRPCKNNIIVAVFEPKHWPKELIEEIGASYLKKIESKENAKIDDIEMRRLKDITSEKATIASCEKNAKRLEKEAKSLDKKLAKAKKRLDSAKKPCPVLLGIITLGVAALSHTKKVVARRGKKVNDIKASIESNQGAIAKNNEAREKAAENISAIEQRAGDDISSIKESNREIKKAAYFFKNEPGRTLELLIEASAQNGSEAKEPFKPKPTPIVLDSLKDGESYAPKEIISILSEQKGKIPAVFLITGTPILSGRKTLHYVDTTKNLLGEIRSYFSDYGDPIEVPFKSYRWTHRFSVTVYAFGHIVDKDEQAQDMYLKLKELMNEHGINMRTLE